MARGATSLSIFSPINLRNGGSFFLRRYVRRSPTRFYCKSSERYRVSPEYAEAFARRMSLAALKPHHRIAMGVSGGADSMALCAMMAHWKTCSNEAAFDSSGYINGLLAIIVDHGLRLESKEEAEAVSGWVSDMGIRSEVACCDWPSGLPKVGHLEEAARDMRYQIFQDVCSHNRFGVLLTAHHADDQAELLVLRLSRNSGVLGLAGMASTSQIFPNFSKPTVEPSNNFGILLVRPLLELTKEDLYKVCQSNNQKWVEDPTNQSSLFTRNRIRMALQDLKTCALRSEVQALIAVCRQTRLYVDHICQILFEEAVTIMPHGYIIIDLELLNPSNRADIWLSRFLTLVLQFVLQRQRPVRGSASKLLLQYIQSFPCKTSLTAAGCYLCPAPGTKGTKILVCCSVESSCPAKTEIYSTYRDEGLKQYVPCDAEQIVRDQKSVANCLVPDTSDVHFLYNVASNCILNESRRLKILSDSTCKSIAELQKKEKQLFMSKKEVLPSSELKKGTNSASAISEPLKPGESCYFMNRFFLTWLSNHKSDLGDLDNGEHRLHEHCSLCRNDDVLAYVRHMVDEDWLYLANLSRVHDSDKLKQKNFLNTGVEQLSDGMSLFSKHASSSAEQALRILKCIPVAARRGLPVIVSPEGIPLSIPTIGFSQCPSQMISAQFRPRVPLGGGHSSFT